MLGLAVGGEDKPPAVPMVVPMRGVEAGASTCHVSGARPGAWQGGLQVMLATRPEGVFLAPCCRCGHRGPQGCRGACTWPSLP